jgi:hypothetical protein
MRPPANAFFCRLSKTTRKRLRKLSRSPRHQLLLLQHLLLLQLLLLLTLPLAKDLVSDSDLVERMYHNYNEHCAFANNQRLFVGGVG